MLASLLPAPAAPRAAAPAAAGSRRPQPLAQRSLGGGSRGGCSLAARAHRVEVELLSGEVEVLEVGEGDSILSAIMDKGIDTPYDCTMGVCLRCAAKLEEGEVDQEAGMLSQDVQEKGYALLCVSLPRSDCRVRIIPEDELADEAMATSKKAQEAAAALAS